ncbi:hypothetical protein [Ornithinimicrobium cryptoxanthini]|uniref:hypothetical protein n=1 Tax=Ornithinimicrobium cryptoxanthini TaxID=2934161 RepID=UPI002119A625|nr:hypothetical protein [Ornithinimicrobium cryptoxanthini]
MPTESLSDIPLGERVTVRHRLADGRASDAVGRITARDRDALTLHTRRGEVHIPLDAVLVHRVVQAVPWRIARFLGRAEVAVLDLGTVLRHADVTTPLLVELERAGTPLFLLTADGEGAATSLAEAGLGVFAQHLLDGDCPAAHAEIEARLARVVGPGLVHFTDERPPSVETAREWGWQARVFTPPD